MLTYLEEKTYREAHRKLHQHQLRINHQYQMDENVVEASDISDKEKENYLALIIDNYDRGMKLAEQEYDRAINKIRSWKKIRKER